MKSTETHKKIRAFYKASVGQQILARNEERAIEILKAILIVAYCQTDGKAQGTNQFTECEKQKCFLISVLNPEELISEEESQEDSENSPFSRPEVKNLFDYEENDEAFSSEPHNTWLQIANNIDDQAQELAKEEYDEHEKVG